MTPEEQILLVKVDTMLKRVEQMEDLLKQAVIYVQAHYERSAVGTGQSARILMNQIKALLGLR